MSDDNRSMEQAVPDSQRRSRRPNRGRRGRGRGRGRPGPIEPRPEPPVESEALPLPENQTPPAVEPEPVRFEDLPPAEEVVRAEPDIPFPEAVSGGGHPEPELAEERENVPPATLEQAIDQVTEIISTLRQSLDDMEEVLELLESLERQTGASERELESLRRALRQLHRPSPTPQHYRGRH